MGGPGQMSAQDPGRLFCVLSLNRLDDLMETLLGHRALVFIACNSPMARLTRWPKVVLVRSHLRRGRQGLKVEPPIDIYGPDQQYTPEMKAIHYGD